MNKYKVLDVSKSSPDSQIEFAYRLAKERAGDDIEKILEVSIAYEEIKAERKSKPRDISAIENLESLEEPELEVQGNEINVTIPTNYRHDHHHYHHTISSGESPEKVVYVPVLQLPNNYSNLPQENKPNSYLTAAVLFFVAFFATVMLI